LDQMPIRVIICNSEYYTPVFAGTAHFGVSIFFLLTTQGFGRASS
jgi:hypothetical protein